MAANGGPLSAHKLDLFVMRAGIVAINTSM